MHARFPFRVRDLVHVADLEQNPRVGGRLNTVQIC